MQMSLLARFGRYSFVNDRLVSLMEIPAVTSVSPYVMPGVLLADFQTIRHSPVL